MITTLHLVLNKLVYALDSTEVEEVATKCLEIGAVKKCQIFTIKILQNSRNVSRKYTLRETRINMCFKPRVFSFRRIKLSHTSTQQDHNENHNRQRQRTYLNNDARYSLANVCIKYIFRSGKFDVISPLVDKMSNEMFLNSNTPIHEISPS